MLTRFRSTLILVAATAGLSGCVGLDPYGYGSGVSVGYGYGGGYSPYGYGYGSPYGSYGYGAGYGSPYYGWYDDFYYPGTGYYVYNRSGSRYRWTDAQRRYWEQRRGDRRGGENWSGYRSPNSALEGWADRNNGGAVSTNGTREVRSYRRGDNRGVREVRRQSSDSSPVFRESRRERSESSRGSRSESRSSSRGPSGRLREWGASNNN